MSSTKGCAAAKSCTAPRTENNTASAELFWARLSWGLDTCVAELLISRVKRLEQTVGISKQDVARS